MFDFYLVFDFRFFAFSAKWNALCIIVSFGDSHHSCVGGVYKRAQYRLDNWYFVVYKTSETPLRNEIGKQLLCNVISRFRAYGGRHTAAVTSTRLRQRRRKNKITKHPSNVFEKYKLTFLRKFGYREIKLKNIYVIPFRKLKILKHDYTTFTIHVYFL